MQIIPIPTRIMRPPQDDLYKVLDESLTDVREKDIVVITSKVVSIHQGRCQLIVDHETKNDKDALVRQEADYYIPREEALYDHPITIAHHALISSAGIDESNADGHYVLLPKNITQICREIWKYIRTRFNIIEVGIVISDSHSSPLRAGATGVAIGWFGFEPLILYAGKPDLFAREMKVSRSNVVDALAAASGLVMGEGAECIPVVVVRGVPSITFTDTDTTEELLIPLEEDMFFPLLKPFLKGV